MRAELARPFSARSDLPSWSISWAWAAVALASGVLRLAEIDRVPLAESEATYAFSAWQAALGQLDSSLAGTGAPLLAHLMAGLFWLFGASDLAARLVPALAGVGLALSPALLSGMLGRRVALLAGLLIGISPIAVQLSRTADPGMVTAALAMVFVASAIRLLTDRPWWASWSLAGAAGLSVAHHPGVVIALITAGLAALASWTPSRRGLVAELRGMARPGARGPAALGATIALVALTGGLMDLSGAGFFVGPLWGEAVRLLSPAPFLTRNLAALLAYAGPLIALAAAGFVLAARQGDRLAVFLGNWSLLLTATAAGFGASVQTFAVLPIAPIALLAAMALSRLQLDPGTYRLSGACWAAIALSLGGVAGVLVVFAHSVGADRPTAPITFLALAALVGLVAVVWRQRVTASERGAALTLLGALGFVAWTAGTVGRVSYGGSPPGTELLAREETHPALRAAFRDINVLASADGRTMVFDAATPLVARWYGRAIAQMSSRAGPPPPGSILVREAPVAVAAGAGVGTRTPWKTVSLLDRADLHPLGVLRWTVSRIGLVRGNPRDIIITR